MLRLFEYNPKRSVVHSLDPRAKIYFSGVFIAATLLTNNLTLLSLICSLLLFFTWRARILSDAFKGLRGFTYFMLIILLVDAILFSLEFALTMVTKFAAIVLSFLLLLMTTSSDELLQVMEYLRLPMEAVMALSIALRYVPTMIREAELIFDAQKARGVSFQKGNIIRKLRGYMYFLIPLIAISARKALHIAESMEARGFGAKNRRTNLNELKMRGKDYAAVATATLILIIILLFEFLFVLPSWVTLNHIVK